MNKLKRFGSNLRASFWFLPALIVAFSTVVAVGLIEVDSSGSQDWMADWPRLFGANAAGARGMLATIAGSMTTVVGVTFSMTLVALTLASIRGGDEGGFVPSLSVAFSVGLAIGGIATLIFFIHHIASSIQASSIIASVTKETLVAVDRLFPGKLGREPMADEADQSLLPLPTRTWQDVMARRNGYLQSVDTAALLRLARKHKTIVRMDRGIGEFVVQNTPLASLALENPPDQEIIAALRAAYNIDRYLTVHQDCAFGTRQLVDMALRSHPASTTPRRP